MAKVFEGSVGAGPVVAPASADSAGRDRADHGRALGGAHCGGFPASEQGRVEHHHAAGEFGVACGAHDAQEPAERVAHQISRLASLDRFGLREIVELRDQVRPVAGDRVARVMAELVHRLDGEATCAQVLEQYAVGRRGKTVAVREDDEAQMSLSSGRVILRSGLLPSLCTRSGVAV